MALFKTSDVDGKSLPFIYQSAQSGTSNALISLEFRNKDVDSHSVYDMACIRVYDTEAQKGRPNVDGHGALAMCTRCNGTVTEVIRLTDTGNVGIGTTAPRCKLEVDGDACVTSNLVVRGDIEFSGDLLRNGLVYPGEVSAGSAGTADTAVGHRISVSPVFRSVYRFVMDYERVGGEVLAAVRLRTSGPSGYAVRLVDRCRNAVVLTEVYGASSSTEDRTLPVQGDVGADTFFEVHVSGCGPGRATSVNFDTVQFVFAAHQ